MPAAHLADHPAALEMAPEPAPERPAPTRGWRLGTALVPTAVGAAGALMSWRLGLWDEDLPGAGFYPMFASLIIFAGGICLLIRQDPLELEPPIEGEVRRVLLGVSILLLYAACFTLIGVISTSLLTCFLWLKLLARESWVSSLMISVGAGAFIYVLFIRLLQLPLPLDAFLGR